MRVLDDLEITRLSQVFSAIDTSCDGILSQDELVLAFRASISPEQAEREVDKLLKRLDKNQNGEVDYSEFLLSALPCERLLTRANLRLAFRALDKDGSGQLSLAELKAFFRINSKPGSMEQWKRLVAGVDSSGDGEISFEEFEALMKV
jgi:calcium-dependent protein kinase